MQPYQYGQAPYGNDQGYQAIPEDQAYPVFWRRRRRDIDFIFPIVIPFGQNFYPYPYPLPYPYPYPYPLPTPFPYGGFGGF